MRYSSGLLSKLLSCFLCRQVGARAWIKSHFMLFAVPKHASLLYALGGVLLFGLLLQIITGISMAIHYVPVMSEAFMSVNLFVRNFKYGWLVRSAHINGASLLFCVLYAHMFRAVYYRSYVGNRRIVWLIGSIAYILIMCISFMGYVLPWGQLSYWAAVVIANVIGSVPLVGKWMRLFVLGGYSVRDALLKRFFVFHCVLPFVLFFLITMHVALVHFAGQNDLAVSRLPVASARINIFPVYALKDFICVCVYLLVLAALCLVFPDVFSNRLNFEPADFYNTPADIKPEWYFMHYYSLLRIFESKLTGICLVALTLTLIALLPYTHEELSSVNFEKLYRPCVVGLFASFVILGVLGTVRLSYWSVVLAKLCVLGYFSFFLWPVAARIFDLTGLRSVKWLF
ncbi:cytochrome b N-terminal domain-containing protein [Candidatus Hodgkinia cicadicola]